MHDCMTTCRHTSRRTPDIPAPKLNLIRLTTNHLRAHSDDKLQATAYSIKMSSPTSRSDPSLTQITDSLRLRPHPEGGFFTETDRHPLEIRLPDSLGTKPRPASSSIYYLLTLESPLGTFHRTQCRTIHTLHRGRGRYVIIHADLADADGNHGKAPVETFAVGGHVEKGERLQWVVEEGKYKGCYIEDQEGLLISEVRILAGAVISY